MMMMMMGSSFSRKMANKQRLVHVHSLCVRDTRFLMFEQSGEIRSTERGRMKLKLRVINIPSTPTSVGEMLCAGMAATTSVVARGRKLQLNP